jgi:hypothetical protein
VSARALAPTIAAVEDPAALESAADLATGALPGSLTVFLPDGTALGAASERDAQVDAAAGGRAFTTATTGGAAALVPVLRADGAVAVVRVFVPAAALNEGVAQAWAMLAALGVVLVAVAAGGAPPPGPGAGGGRAGGGGGGGAAGAGGGARRGPARGGGGG